MSITLAKYFVSKWNSFRFAVLALAFSASIAWAQAPSILFNAQQTAGNGYNDPQALIVSSNGTVFVADTGNNRIIALATALPQLGASKVISTAPFVLTAPEGLALDAVGDLFIGDAPASGGRIIELFGDGHGNLSTTAAPKLIVSGAPLVNPTALVFDSAGTLFIGDSSANGNIYSLAAGTGTLKPLTFTGALPAQFTPAALLRDASDNLYISDNGYGTSDLGGIFKGPDTGGTTTQIPTQQFFLNEPSGMAFDAAGDLYVATAIGTTSAVQQILVIPAASPDTPYLLPVNGLDTAASLAFDPNGNLDVADFFAGAVVQFSSLNPVNLGSKVFVGKAGSPIQFNFELNAPAHLSGFRVLTQGDLSTEISQAAGGNCTLGNHNTQGNGGPTVSAYYPYVCTEFYEGTPAYPGIRNGAIQVEGTGKNILASVPVWQTGLAAAEVTYPLNATTTVKTLQQPQAITISGLNNTVYVADTQAGKVYSYATGLAATKQTTVNTGSIALSAPLGLAQDGAGDLFIADYETAEVVEVPTTTGVAPSIVNTGGLLKHPIAIALDFLGNLYIGDAGPAGFFNTASDPGFIVKVPVGGAAFKMPNPAAFSVIYPQALATDPYTADLLIGDGGDPSGVGQVDRIYANGSGGETKPIAGVTDPTGLAFDAADDLYILDGTANDLTVVSSSPSETTRLVEFNNSTLSSASALAISAGGQSFVIADIGAGSTNSLLYLNGNASTLAFGNVDVGSAGQPQTATVYNIGNLDLTLSKPYYATNEFNAAFDVLNSSTCTGDLLLAPSAPCSINIQFKPQFPGFTSQQIIVESNAYNGTTGNPVLTVQGTGGAGVVKHRRRERYSDRGQDTFTGETHVSQ